MDLKKLKMVIESLIFISEEPVSLKRLTELIENTDRDEIKEAITELGKDLVESDRGIALFEIAGGYQFRTTPSTAFWVSKLFEGKPQRLTKAGLETMAIIAYKQPLVRSDIEKIRGVDSGGVIKTLLERDLIRIVGRQDVPGRPALYSTTEKFLQFFGLKNLSEMPDLKEITALGDASEENIAAEAPEREQLQGTLPGEGGSVEETAPAEGATLAKADDSEDEHDEHSEKLEEPVGTYTRENASDLEREDDDEGGEQDSDEISMQDLPLAPLKQTDDDSEDSEDQ